MEGDKKITGIVFTDLGQAGSFMGLDWVQRILKEKVGFAPYPGTLNLRLTSPQGIARWKDLRQSMKGVDIPSPEPSFCRARCFPARIDLVSGDGEDEKYVAVLVPEVEDYPADKLEVIAPFHVKTSLRVEDGDSLTLEFFGD